MMIRQATRGVPEPGNHTVRRRGPAKCTRKPWGSWFGRFALGHPRRMDPGESKGGKWNMSMVVDWPSMAACRNGDPDALFVQGAEQNVAKRICRSCPVRYECLADALDNRIEFG